MSDYIEQQNQNLIQNINNQINTINSFIDWSNANLNQSRREITFKELINKRRLLKRIRFSLENKPAIAAFGESQKGKSYVISSLLARKGKQLMVRDPKTNEEFNFVERLNPITRDVEATGVATRFTKSYKIIDENYPIMVRILSIADILQILCDTAYNDVKTHPIIEHEDIDEFIAAISRRYQQGVNVQTAIDEDEIMNIREYIDKHIGINAKELLDSAYFDILARFIGRVQSREWPEIFSKLWYDNSDITDLFRRLLEGYECIGFSKYIYIPISALDNKTMTLMSSLCLQQLDNDYPLSGNTDASTGTDLMTIDGHIKNGFSKSVLSAIASEVVIQIPAETIEEELVYHTEGIWDESQRQRLLSKGWNKKIRKDFLNSVDIFDFPGARANLELSEEQVHVELKKQMVLRGKVRYLFNKYSDEQLINVLLLCHDHMQVGPTVMPGLVEQWIKQNVGSTSEERTAFIDKSVVSPLFIIATKFNMDMGHSVQEGGDNLIENRWKDRYKKVLYDQVLQVNSKGWFSNWTSYGSFKNTYLLRDFKYSGINGNRLFEGYDVDGTEATENDIDFHKTLRASFIASPDVNIFFDDPELSWDAAATLNNDGATRIIENLSTAAANVKESRLDRFQKIIYSLHSQTLQLMQEYYHDENDDDILNDAIKRCGAIMAEFDIVTGKDNYFFGRAINQLQINEHTIFDYFFHELNSTQNIDQQDTKEYNLILHRCNGSISAQKSFDENLNTLCQVYRIPNKEECIDFFEKRKGISLNKLFSCDFKQKCNSEFLAEGIVTKWLDSIRSQKSLKFFEKNNFSTLTVLDLIDNMSAVISNINLTGIITHRISPLVDTINVPPQILDMIADTTAEIINNFVVNFGYNYYSSQKIEELKEINEKHNLSLTFNYKKESAPSSPEEISNLFDKIRPTDENVSSQQLPSFVNYFQWIEYLTISFISSYNIPNYDIEANRQLGILIKSYQEMV